jgi:hypothetical protein
MVKKLLMLINESAELVGTMVYDRARSAIGADFRQEPVSPMRNRRA